MNCNCLECVIALEQITQDFSIGAVCGCSDCYRAERQLINCPYNDSLLNPPVVLPAPKVGRPATGRTTKTVRVPLDMDEKLAIKMYYDWLPVLRAYYEVAMRNPKAVRHEKLIRMFDDIGYEKIIRMFDDIGYM
jgi:hypothetical protein